MLGIKRFQIHRLTKKLKSMQQNRILNQPEDMVLKQEIGFYHQLAGIYQSLIGSKKYPFAREMVHACLSAAAAMNDTKAQYQLGKSLLDEAKFRQEMQAKQVFASQSNEERMRVLFNEAHAYLTAAQKLDHIEAKRLIGLCYINGWGVKADRDIGFTLIVESINQENSWDRVPQIFAAIGLNKPEFFSALMQHRKSS